MRRASRAVAAAVLALGLAGCSLTPDDSPTGTGTGRSDDEVNAGKAATRLPEATLAPLSGGRSLDLRGLKGPAVVNVWASWCGPCREELPRYAAFAKAYAGKVDVVGIDFQDTQPDAARQLAKRSGVTYPLYRDPDGVMTQVMRLRGLPQVVLVDARGKVVLSQATVIDSEAQLRELVATHLGVRG